MSHRPNSEGLKAARLLMVLSSMSPLFIIWAIRGNDLVCDRYFISFCVIMVIVPNAFLGLRISIAKKLQEKREIVAGKAEDHREHLLVYLFAMLLPFYTASLGTWREFSAVIAALAFIVFLFWHLNLHYINVLFALLGYRVFTIYPPMDRSPFTGQISQVLITRRTAISPGERLIAHRISDTVYIEVGK
jgi:hypothetical protein